MNGRILLLLASCAFVYACSSTPPPPGPPKCTPGASQACAGEGGCSGFQVCGSDGTFQPCACQSSGSDAGNDAGTNEDGGVDAGATPVCNPIAQTGCGSTERCTWVVNGPDAGELACRPDGTVAADGLCTVGTDRFDDCVRGTACDGYACGAICDPTAPSCSSGRSCQRYSAAIGAGICTPTCDPVTQMRDTDGAAFCGSTSLSSPNRGCYGTPTDGFVCAKSGPASNTSDVAPSPAFLNSCAPGFEPLIFGGNGSTQVICVAFCKPAPTSTLTPQNAGGQPDSGYTCADRGAGGTHECRYIWWLYPLDSFNQYSDTVGYCQDPTKYMYDSDNDGGLDTVYPSCKTLSKTAHTYDPTYTDTQYWGCEPHP